ncbi:MAG: M14 family zinc carboxypeptidase [Sphingobacteriaceae bacterium]|nr:M14 family zinc carboxypeptidase [Sphingobacteriaceae bacterium]
MQRFKRFFWLVPAFLLMSQFNPQSSRITEKFFPEKEDLPEVTPALKKQKGFTNYEELTAFLKDLCARFPEKISLSYIGNTKKGLAIPLVRLNSGSAEGKVKVWMQGGLHGDEPASTEALLYLLHQLLHDPAQAALLQKIDLAVLPMANIDGYLKQTRNNAENLDLNRDQTKLMAAESALYKRAFAAFQPQVALDFHEYRPFRRDFAKMSSFGVTSAYDVMFLYSGNLNVPASLRQFTQEVFLEPTRALLTQHQLTHHDYVSTDTYQGEIHFNQGSNNARSSATNFALQNTVSTLVEVRGVGLGRTSFKRRIFTGYLIAKSYLDIAAAQATAVQQAIATANNSIGPITVTSKKHIYVGPLDFIDLEKTERIQLDVTLRDAWQSKATLSRPRPTAYLIESSEAALISKIEPYGLRVDRLTEAKSFEIEQFTVQNYQRAAMKYEKMSLQDVSTSSTQLLKTFPAGSYFIPVNQPAGNILFELLEPEAPNSFVSFGVLATQAGKILPIYRVIQ